MRPCGTRRIVSWVGGFLLLACLDAGVLAQKTDVVLLRNGDEVTGEIKELQQGLLRYSTHSMSTIYIEWVDVVRIYSDKSFQIETTEGDFFFGTFAEPDEDFKARLSTGIGPVDFPMNRIVEITPIKPGFWKQLDGSLSLGANFTKASDVLQTTISGNTVRRARRYLAEFRFNSILTSQKDKNTTQNSDVTYGYTRFLSHRWNAGGTTSLQRNDETGIDLRLLVTSTGGRNLVQTNRQFLAMSAGLAFNREEAVDVPDPTTSIEAVANLNWMVFKFKSPKTDLRLETSVFPSLTEKDRIRTDFRTDLRHELVKDFFWSLEFYHKYDSNPPTEDAATTDLGFTTSLGWTF